MQYTDQQRNSRQNDPGRYRQNEGSSGQWERPPYGRRDEQDFYRGQFDERFANSRGRDFRDDWLDRSDQDRGRFGSVENRGQYGTDFSDRDRFSNRDYGSRNSGARDQFGRKDYFQNYGDNRAGQFNEYPHRSNWNGSDSQFRGQNGRDDTQQFRDERGRFAGTGPKNYRRSDERIQDDLCEQLTRDPHLDASEIDCRVKDGEVTLSGTVTHRHSKRMAEDIAENVSGVKEVRNEIRVKREDSEQMQSDSTQQRPAASNRAQATKM